MTHYHACALTNAVRCIRIDSANLARSAACEERPAQDAQNHNVSVFNGRSTSRKQSGNEQFTQRDGKQINGPAEQLIDNPKKEKEADRRDDGHYQPRRKEHFG